MTQELTNRVLEARFSQRLNERESVVLDILMGETEDSGHFGRERAVSGGTIRDAATRRGIRMDRRALSEAVASLLVNFRIPIGTSKGQPAGYFLTETDEEQAQAAEELWAQIVAMLRRYRVLSPKTRHGRELAGQLAAVLEDEGREEQQDERKAA